ALIASVAFARTKAAREKSDEYREAKASANERAHGSSPTSRASLTMHDNPLSGAASPGIAGRRERLLETECNGSAHPTAAGRPLRPNLRFAWARGVPAYFAAWVANSKGDLPVRAANCGFGGCGFFLARPCI